MEVVDILRAVDIVEYVGQYVELEQRGEEFWGISPFKNENTPSFSVRRDSGNGIGKFYDFSSGIGGNCITFAKFFFKVTAQEATEMIRKYAGLCDGGRVVVSRKLNATNVCRKYIPARQEKKGSSATVLPSDYMNRYLDRKDKLQVWRDEGITDDVMDFFSVKYDDFSNCIVYPIRDIDGNIVNVGGRTLNTDFKALGIRKYTYFKPWGGQMSIVYGLNENMESILKKREVILFEGVKSVMIARVYGFNNCGAILTSHLNQGQLKILVKLGVRVVFALDKDVKVKEDHNIQRLKRYVGVEYIYDYKDLLDDKDSPVDNGKDVFEKLYKNRLVMR